MKSLRDLLLTSSDIWAMAGKAQGEAEVLGFPGMYLVAYTMLCRLADPRFPDDVTEMLRAYYAPTPEPVSIAAIRAVIAAMQERDLPPLYYALSRQDLDKLGGNPPPATVMLRRGPFELHLFDEWHWSRTYLPRVEG